MVHKGGKPFVQFRGGSIVLGEISRATGMSVSHLSRIFAGESLPSLNGMVKLAAYLGLSMDDLYAELTGKGNSAQTHTNGETQLHSNASTHGSEGEVRSGP